MKRIYSIDLTRGIVMIIMALDHVRDYMHTTSINFQPTDLRATTPLLFFTRWITHLCAPTFVFLAGTSAFLSMQATNSIADTRKFLLTRGIWLIIVEFTLVNFAMRFDIHVDVLLFEVIAATGTAFIVLALLLNCSTKTIGIIGLAILFLHNLAPLVPGPETSAFKKILMPVFSPAAFPIGGRILIIGYPPLPWVGVMLVGFASGRFFALEMQKMKSLFLKIGLASIGLFIILRFINIYGDMPWTQQKSGMFTFLSFMNLTKYPPSLDFCLVFLGIMFLILSAVQGKRGKWTEVVSVFGKVPLFYFVVHLYIIHLAELAMVSLQGVKVANEKFGFNFNRPKSGSGLELWGIYLAWICLVVMMYPLCKWYGRYKANNRDKKWLRYL
jgi:uncharacterized membrane protein